MTCKKNGLSMRDTGGSKTAVGAALMRAAHQILDLQPRWIEDPLAVGFIPGSSAEEIAARREELNAEVLRYMRADVISRDRAAENELESAVGDGIEPSDNRLAFPLPLCQCLQKSLSKRRREAMSERDWWTKRCLPPLMAIVLLWTVAPFSLADQHEGVTDAAKGLAQERMNEAGDPMARVTGEGDPGQQAFVQYCASCHGTDAKGQGPLAETLKTQPADLTQIRKKNGGEFESDNVARMIDGQQDVTGHGPRDMPVWGVEFAKEAGTIPVRLKARYAQASILQLVRYLESLQE